MFKVQTWKHARYEAARTCRATQEVQGLCQEGKGY